MDQSDLEKPDYLSKLEAAQPEQPHEKVDIEHARVENDPRGWSKSKKACRYRLRTVSFYQAHTCHPIIDVHSGIGLCCIDDRRPRSEYL